MTYHYIYQSAARNKKKNKNVLIMDVNLLMQPPLLSKSFKSSEALYYYLYISPTYVLAQQLTCNLIVPLQTTYLK